MSIHLQAWMKPTDHRASVLFAVTYLRLVGSKSCTFATSSNARSLLVNAKISKLAAMAEENSRQGFWRIYFAGKRVELYYRRYAVIDGLADALKTLTEVLNLLD